MEQSSSQAQKKEINIGQMSEISSWFLIYTHSDNIDSYICVRRPLLSLTWNYDILHILDSACSLTPIRLEIAKRRNTSLPS